MATDEITQQAAEHATRVFLKLMAREAARKHPQRIENPVPSYDQIGRRDQLILINAIMYAVKAANSFAEANRSPSVALT